MGSGGITQASQQMCSGKNRHISGLPNCLFGGAGFIVSLGLASQVDWSQPCAYYYPDSDLHFTCYLGCQWKKSTFRRITPPLESGLAGHYPGQERDKYLSRATKIS